MGNTTQNIHETRLMHIEMARSKAILDNSKLQAKIDSLTDAQHRGADREVLNLMVGNIQQAHSNLSEGARLSIDQQIFPLMLEERDLLEEYGPDHPLVLAVQKRIALARSHFLGSKNQGGKLGSRPRDFFEVYLESLRVEVAMNIRTIQHMNQLFEHERAASKLLAFDQVTDQAYRSKIARKSRLFDVVLKRLEEINLIKDAGGAVVQVIHPPDSGIQHMTSLYSVLLTSGLLALVFGLGLAFAVDATDHRYRSPDEIRDDLSLPVIGHIPRFSKSRTKSKSLNAPATSLLAPELQTIIEPRGVTAEAIRAVRTAVYFSANGSGAKVIQVTSPFPLDGKSTVAANLAVSIANTGKSVLLIDADFRSPNCHKLFNLDNRMGMTGVMLKAYEAATCKQKRVA